jgi:predicted DsbA family dithiol-disulfide isomerase
MYSDLLRPFAYVAAWRVRRLRDEYRGRVTIQHKSLSLEYVNSAVTSKAGLDAEIALLFVGEAGLPWMPWSAPDAEWPSTVWPAFEAVKCAERQSYELAGDLDWALRHAVRAESRCIATRHVILDVAESVGLDMARFTDDFDGGVCKRLVLEEAREGWEQLRVNGSPTFVLPSGRQLKGPALPSVTIDSEANHKVLEFTPAPCEGDACLDVYREMLDEAIATAGWT